MTTLLRRNTPLHVGGILADLPRSTKLRTSPSQLGERTEARAADNCLSIKFAESCYAAVGEWVGVVDAVGSR